MLFNSFLFWLFYAVVLAVYFRSTHRQQNVWLLVSSYFFYGCWDPRFLSLIVLSTLMDYVIGRQLEIRTNRRLRKTLLIGSLCGNLGILGFFKYYGFFAGELSQLLTVIGLPALLPTLDIVLPVGISFYTFQTMSYTIDVYRGTIKPTRSLLDFAVYVAFFPQLVAGPIERAAHFLPQVMNPRRQQTTDFRDGLYLILLGLFKKIVIADNMAVFVNAIFASPAESLTGVEVLLGVYAFAFQIYGDFSGYSAIARGVAKWLGFDLLVNFRMPYFATTPSDFWQRWHISLSQWLRDYLYIPLGGNRGGTLLTYRNLVLTMLLGGLWHGANWTFLAWGGFHGLLLCAYRVVDHARHATSADAAAASPRLWSRLPAMIFMFHAVCLGWLLFRADSLAQAGEFTLLIASDWTWTPLARTLLGMLVFLVGPLLAYEAWLEFRGDLAALLTVPWQIRSVVYCYAVLMCVCFPPPVASSFIYFQF